MARQRRRILPKYAALLAPWEWPMKMTSDQRPSPMSSAIVGLSMFSQPSMP
jgi:hypothetical protein